MHSAKIASTGKDIDLSSLSRSELEKAYVLLNEQLCSANAKISWYEEQYRLSKQRTFGKSSEKISPDQLSLYDLQLLNEAEALREPINVEPSAEELAGELKPEKSKKCHKRITKLPVVTTVYELTGEECKCGKCGSCLSFMKDIIQTEIEVQPAKVYINKSVSKQYTCRNCDKNGVSGIITSPGAPIKVIPGSCASESLIADSISKKYVDAVPFYRQEQNYKRNDIPVTRNNLCNWSIRVANDYFKSIVDKMREILYNEGVLHCDETHVEVLNEPDRPASRQSWIWVTTSTRYSDKQISLYNYTEGRSEMDARKVLSGYEGYIICDAYKSYDALLTQSKKGDAPMNVKLVACLVHVRRKFKEALDAVKPEFRSGTGAETALAKLSKIFNLDNKWDILTPEERKNKRLAELKPALDDFFAWVKSEYDISVPKMQYGQALNYALEQKEKIMRVLDDGRLELENNKAERAVKPFVIGRKNWLFSNTPAGAEASCILYSIVETAKNNNLIPYEYLKYIMSNMKGKKITNELVEKLLPWAEDIPDYVKAPAEAEI